MSKAGNGSIAIVNPNSGPGTFRNPPYVEALRYCHRQGQQVIGYVSTDYATRPLAATLSDIAKYYRWYRVDGIFLDEMSNFPTARAAGGRTVANYYSRVHDRIKQRARDADATSSGTRSAGRRRRGSCNVRSPTRS